MNRDPRPPLDYVPRYRTVNSTLHALQDRRRVDLYERLAANDLEYREREKRVWGGRAGLASVFLICVLIGLLLATGGVL